MTTNNKILLGTGVVVFGYLLWRNHQIHLEKQAGVSFVGDRKIGKRVAPTKKITRYIAGGYVPNPNGIGGKTWMALSTDGTRGYWAPGEIDRGTEVCIGCAGAGIVTTS
jgi:hypothetical protein